MTTILVNGLRVDIGVDVATPNELRQAAGYDQNYDFFELGLGYTRKITNEDCAIIKAGKRYNAIRKGVIFD